MDNKLWSIDELHDLLGEAVGVIRESLRSQDPNVRLAAAVQLLQYPVTFAVSLQQKAKEDFPNTLEVKK